MKRPTYYKIEEVVKALRMRSLSHKEEIERQRHANEIEKNFTVHINNDRNYVIDSDLENLLTERQYKFVQAWATGYNIFSKISQ